MTGPAEHPLAVALDEAARRRPWAPALTAQDRGGRWKTLEYAELRRASDSAARQLSGAPRPAVLAAGNRIDDVVQILGAAVADVPILLVDPQAPRERVAKLTAAVAESVGAQVISPRPRATSSSPAARRRWRTAPHHRPRSARRRRYRAI